MEAQKSYHLSKLNWLSEKEANMINEASALMPLLEKVIDRSLDEVESELDSDKKFEVAAYEAKMTDLLAQRRVLKKLKKLFQEVDHA
jgi:hypothetical protein